MKWHNYNSSLMSGILIFFKICFTQHFCFSFYFSNQSTLRRIFTKCQKKYKKKKKKKKESSSYSSPMCKTGPFRFNNMIKKKDESIISSFIPNWFFLPPFFLSCCCQLEKSSGWMNQKADAGMKSAIIVSRLQIFIILKTDINRNVNS